MRINMSLSKLNSALFAPAVAKDDSSSLIQIAPSAILHSAAWKTAAAWGLAQGFQLFGRYGMNPAVFSLCAFASVSIIEFVRAQYTAKEANLENYHHCPHPDAETLRYLVDNPFLLYELLDQGADLTKTDPNGNSLLFTAVAKYDSDVSSLDLLFTAPWPPEEVLKCFVHMAEFKEDLLSLAVEKKWGRGAALNPNSQMALWMAIRSQKGAELLKQMGCDPNVRDASGKTPLLKTAAGEYYGECALQQAELLLAAGADPNASVFEGGIQKNGLQLAQEAKPQDPGLIQFLKSRVAGQ